MSSAIPLPPQPSPDKAHGMDSSAARPPAPESANRGKILLVDDDPLVGRMLHAWLLKKGYESPLAFSPTEADKLLAASTFELVLSDVNMPGNFRLEWVERLLSDRAVPPILLITGAPALETACRAANLPIAGYLLKPLDFSTLDDVIQRVLQEHRRRTEFISLAEDIVQLLPPRGIKVTPEEGALVGRLAQLSARFRAQTGRLAADRPSEEAWRATISDTIAVIEKTKHSFRSKELGQLRLRLQQILLQSEAS